MSGNSFPPPHELVDVKVGRWGGVVVVHFAGEQWRVRMWSTT